MLDLIPWTIHFPWSSVHLTMGLGDRLCTSYGIWAARMHRDAICGVMVSFAAWDGGIYIYISPYIFPHAVDGGFHWVPKIWLPQIPQIFWVMDDQVLKPKVTWGIGILRNSHIWSILGLFMTWGYPPCIIHMIFGSSGINKPSSLKLVCQFSEPPNLLLFKKKNGDFRFSI